MGDMGDIGHLFKEGSIADLDWLDVPEGSYRKEDVLPRQNLDIKPDLEALWARDGSSPVNHLIPNTTNIPGAQSANTMGDLSDVHGPLRSQALEIRKIARLALMQSSDLGRFKATMTARFDSDALLANRDVLASVLSERGLLGKLYVAAEDFPGCHNGIKNATTFVRRFAKEARFVLAGAKCADCSHNQMSPTGGSNCAVFHKQIELEVPYTEQLAQAVEQSQGFEPTASHLVPGPITKHANGESREVTVVMHPPKERIRLAMLNERVVQGGVYQGQGVGKLPRAPSISQRDAAQKLVQAGDLVKSKRASAQSYMEAQPVLSFLRREMVKGLSEAELKQGLKLSFSRDVLAKTVGQWGKLLKEAGLYGVIYSTQGSFDDCRIGADFFAKHNPSVRAIVAGDKCGSCIYSKVSTCMMYGKKLVKNASELYTAGVVEQVLQEHRTAGRLQPWSGRTAGAWGEAPREALQAIHKATTQRNQAPATASARLDNMVAYYGGTPDHVSNSQTTREVVKQASQYMNEGLYGKDLLTVLKGRFESRDLMAAAKDLKAVLAEQGLQGIYYVDPTAYADYGKGCNKAASLHRSRNVEFVKQGSKCGSCIHQRKAGFCSKVNKPLVVEPPYTDKRAQQREILASGNSTDIDLGGLINNGANMVAEFEMQNRGMTAEVNAPVEQISTAVEFHNGKIEL